MSFAHREADLTPHERQTTERQIFNPTNYYLMSNPILKPFLSSDSINSTLPHVEISGPETNHQGNQRGNSRHGTTGRATDKSTNTPSWQAPHGSTRAAESHRPQFADSLTHPRQNASSDGSFDYTSRTLGGLMGHMAHGVAGTIGTIGDCARGPRLTLKRWGLDLPVVVATEQGKILEGTGLFTKVSRADVQPGDYGYRHWSADVIRSNGGQDKGDSFIVSGVGRRGELFGSNDHDFVFAEDGGRYRQTVFLRPTKEFYCRFGHNVPNIDNILPPEERQRQPPPVMAQRTELPEFTRPRPKIEHPEIKPPEQNRVADSRSTTFHLHGLRAGSGQRETADAVVRLSAGFDPNKPVHLLVYNHGFGDTAETAYRGSQIDEQMANAPPNTVLIVPEWQRHPASRDKDQGEFSRSGQFRSMLQEAFDRTPALRGQTLQNVSSIGIIAHSAGYSAAESELYKNGLGQKVQSITLLDALYDHQGFDPWLRANVRELASGTKRFQNIFEDTSGASQAQAARVRQMLASAGLPSSNMLEDHRHGNIVLTSSELAQHSIVFKFSTARTGGLGAHMSIPRLYVGSADAATLQL